MKYTPESTSMIGKPVKVYCDGVEIKDCCEADDAEGYVIRAVRDVVSGNISIEGDEFKTERLTGSIRIEVI